MAEEMVKAIDILNRHRTLVPPPRAPTLPTKWGRETFWPFLCFRVTVYASRALTTAEQRYAQLEKETLSIVYSLNTLEKKVQFHLYCNLMF